MGVSRLLDAHGGGQLSGLGREFFGEAPVALMVGVQEQSHAEQQQAREKRERKPSCQAQTKAAKRHRPADGGRTCNRLLSAYE